MKALIAATLFFIAASLLTLSACSRTHPDPVAPINQYTDAPPKTGLEPDLRNSRYRVVWIKGGNLENGGGSLLGYDSKTNTMHTIMKSTGLFSINRPLLFDGGRRIAFTETHDRHLYKTYSIEWDGGNLRFFADGECSQVWRDTSTGKNWYIVRSGGADVFQPVYKIEEDALTNQVLLWNATAVGSSHSRLWYSISADGTRAADCFPWGQGASYLVFNGGLKANGKYWQAPTSGCWYSMAPDNSYYWFHLYWNSVFGGHTGFELYSDTTFKGAIELNSHGHAEEHFHARFASNDSRIIVASVRPQNAGGWMLDSTEIMIGTLNENYTGFSDWTQLTHDTTPDYFPDLWNNIAADEPGINGTLDLTGIYPTSDSSHAKLSLLSPISGDTISGADTFSVLWSVTDSSVASGWIVSYSVNDGKKWIELNNGPSMPPSWRSCSIPCTRITGLRPTTIHIRVHDYSDLELDAVAGPIVVK